MRGSPRQAHRGESTDHVGGEIVAVTGANSAVGRVLLARLAGEATQRVAAGVRRPQALAGLPQSPHIAARLIDYDDSDSLHALVAGADCVVHLAGILFESRRSRYRSANVDTTRALVEASRTAGVRRIVFVSSLGADRRSPNGYFRSKGEAESLVAGAGVDATIIRTPLLLGSDTAGGRALQRDAAQRSVRVLGGGTHRLRPLDVDDLCGAVLGCCQRAAAGVRTYELVGPTRLSYRDLLQRTARLLGNDLSVGSTPIWFARLGARLAGLVRTGGLTPAVIEVITSDETVERNADRDLGISLTPLSATLAKLVEAAGGA